MLMNMLLQNLNAEKDTAMMEFYSRFLWRVS